jgi:hypothetical protein
MEDIYKIRNKISVTVLVAWMAKIRLCNYSPELLKTEETGGSYITYIRKKEACGLN